MIGLDVEKDLLAPLGDEWAYYSDPTTGGKGFLGFTLVNRLRDPKKAEASFVRLQEVINAIVQQQLAGEKVTIAFKETKVDGLTIRYLAVPLVSPAWAIEGGNLYIGLFPSTVAAAAEHVRAKAPVDPAERGVRRRPQAARRRAGGEHPVHGPAAHRAGRLPRAGSWCPGSSGSPTCSASTRPPSSARRSRPCSPTSTLR